ncbi:MAG: hypothetical protein COB85_04630 [Bacteroidetes bacterium]|nr:MAG: hypothetical protein COB85_04630 [Bacteroidota bacterium]
MKYLFSITIALFTLVTFGQQMGTNEWEEQSKTNIRLLPKYGYREKTDHQKELDKKFINETMKQEKFKGDRKAASNHLIELGFSYLYRGDSKTAMYRFNQAYLLDTTNTEIYWGYAGFFMKIMNYAEAAKKYKEGLSLDRSNTHLLTDYGTYFMAQYYGLIPIDEKGALSNLDSAIYYIRKSYSFDNTDMNTTYKLSICYLLKGECNNAWKFFDECKELGGQPIRDEYTKDLKKKCKKKK